MIKKYFFLSRFVFIDWCSKSNSKQLIDEIFSMWIRFRSVWNGNLYTVLCKCGRFSMPKLMELENVLEKESKFSFEVFWLLFENYCSNFHRFLFLLFHSFFCLFVFSLLNCLPHSLNFSYSGQKYDYHCVLCVKK